MSKVFGKIWLFLFFLFLLVCASFFIAFNDSAFSQFFQAGLVSSQQISENNQEDFIAASFDAAQDKLPDFRIIEVENGEVVISEESLEDKLDEIAEKIDIIARQVRDLTRENSPPEADQLLAGEEDQNDENEEKKEENKKEQIQLAKQNPKSSGTKPIYPKILISQVQAKSATDEKDEFVKLYNPNAFVVSLTDWYLQRKTATGNNYTSYASNTLFSGKKIGSNDYFLIARQGYHTGSADMFTDNPITENNTFALKNPNGEISDIYYVESPPEPEPLPEPPPPAPLKNILITEIQIAGLSDEKDEFVELHNSNPFVVNLSGWYLQRKTAGASSYSSYASSTLFSGKTIGSNDYFLISRQGYHTGSADMFIDNPITENNSFILKKSGGEISDKVGLGIANDFETASAPNPPAGQSIKRKWDELFEAYQDKGNNSIDFEISDTPTPRRE